jgi:hypothetical protein
MIVKNRDHSARSRRPRGSFAVTGGTVDDALDGIITALRAAGYEFVIPKSWPAPLDVTPWFIDHWPGYMITEFWARRIDPCEVLVSNGGAVTGLVLGILMALAIGGVAGSTADLDSTTPDTPSDLPTAVDGGADSTELATRAALDDLLSTVLVGDQVVLARWPAAPPWVRHVVRRGQAGRPGCSGHAVSSFLVPARVKAHRSQTARAGLAGWNERPQMPHGRAPSSAVSASLDRVDRVSGITLT